MDNREQLMSFRDAAKVLGVSESFVKKLRRAGKLRVVKLSSRVVRVSAREVERLCRSEN